MSRLNENITNKTQQSKIATVLRFISPYSSDENKGKQYLQDALFGLTLCSSVYMFYLVSEGHDELVHLALTGILGLVYWRPKNIFAVGYGVLIHTILSKYGILKY
ncbi:hypothetical protein Hokovirus_3_290 [Hokovirus HKV1]|uniref:Uncharacterized protein n=1 Tax=Hokovirus HKV1 TaxID=1977638 RepID=A0A1V0SH32_9VIRU|nr:hypothetical protein Hokovirus_3_290 [Hokovirus HKV1]